jgi:hypothetical protein
MKTHINKNAAGRKIKSVSEAHFCQRRELPAQTDRSPAQLSFNCFSWQWRYMIWSLQVSVFVIETAQVEVFCDSEALVDFESA